MKTKLKKLMERALAHWAKRVLRRSQPEIIGVTGSVGKTMTKEAIYSVLATKFGNDVGRSRGNLNTELGLPLTILGFERSPDKWVEWLWALPIAWWRSLIKKDLPRYLVLEMAADKPGDINYLLTIVRPKVAVVTTIGASHLAQFKTIDAVAKEKSGLIASLGSDGIAVLNQADLRVAQMAKLTHGRVVYYRAQAEDLAKEAAGAVGKLYEIPEDEILEGLKTTEGLPGRMRIVPGVNGSTVIDDSYNANPVSMLAALRQLEGVAQDRNGVRKVAILGDMLDLGGYTKQAHQEVIKIAREKADYIAGVGEAMKETSPDKWYSNWQEAAEGILKEIKEGDIILVKGSHGIHLEKVVSKLEGRLR